MCQIVLAEDNAADVGLVRAALREHARTPVVIVTSSDAPSDNPSV
jgi:hypothetical protein